MATVMEFASPPAEFPLGSVFENLPEVTVKLERLLPHDTLVIPYFWVRGAAAEDIETSFDPHAGLRNIRLVDSVEDEYLLSAEWDREYVGILNAFAETELVVLSGVGTSDGWEFEVRGETRDDISDFRTYCQHHDIAIDIRAVHAILPVQGEGYELTEPQRDALVAAYERGFFDSPRAVTLSEVATDLGISQQSLSDRLRRGHRRLIGATLVHD